MAITLGKARQKGGIEGKDRRRIDRIEPIFLVDRLSSDDRPSAVALFEEVIEASCAHDVGQDAVDQRPLIDRHLDLRDGPRGNDVAGESTEKMQNVDAFVEAFPADVDESRRGSLEPGGRHPSIRMPDRREAVPVGGVPPENPVLDCLADRQAIGSNLIHSCSPASRKNVTDEPQSAQRSQKIAMNSVCSSWPLWFETSTSSNFLDRVSHHSDSLDLRFDDIAVIEVFGWRAAEADAFGRSRRDDVAGFERHAA